MLQTSIELICEDVGTTIVYVEHHVNAIGTGYLVVFMEASRWESGHVAEGSCKSEKADGEGLHDDEIKRKNC